MNLADCWLSEAHNPGFIDHQAAEWFSVDLTINECSNHFKAGVTWLICWYYAIKGHLTVSLLPRERDVKIYVPSLFTFDSYLSSLLCSATCLKASLRNQYESALAHRGPDSCVELMCCAAFWRQHAAWLNFRYWPVVRLCGCELTRLCWVLVLQPGFYWNPPQTLQHISLKPFT